MRLIYLDYNATTPLAPQVQEAMLPFLAEHYGNPSSLHALGRACQEAVEDARTRVGRLLAVERDEIVFTSGGTEANNLAIMGTAFRHWSATGQQAAAKGHFVISAFEHPAVAQPIRFLQDRFGFEVTRILPNEHGRVSPRDVEKALRKDTILVSIMHANNEIGVVQPIREISAICRSRGILMHTDAAQSVGKINTRIPDLGVDMLTVAGHKMYAPKGVGALYVRRGVALEPVIRGAGQEAGRRPGTENVAGIVALGRAAALASENLDEVGPKMERQRDQLLSVLQEGIGSELTVNGIHAERLPNTLSVNFPDTVGSELLRRLPELCASTGSACHSGSSKISDSLEAIGLSAHVAQGTIRLSLGWYTTDEDIQRGANALISAWQGAS